MKQISITKKEAFYAKSIIKKKRPRSNAHASALLSKEEYYKHVNECSFSGWINTLKHFSR